MAPASRTPARHRPGREADCPPPGAGAGPAPDLTPEPRLAIVVKGYPRVSETFIAHELAQLERQGLRFWIVSLRRPTDPLTHPVHAAVGAPVLYLPEYLVEAPRRVLAGHRQARREAPARYRTALRQWLRDLARDPTPNRVRRFGQAGVLAAELPRGVRHLHAHFLHTPGSVARYAATMRGLSYSLSGHAKDLWTRPAWEIREKLLGARFTVTCTAAGREHLARLAPGASVHLVHHGLDRLLFAPPPAPGSARDGTDPRDPVRLLAVGRFHPKKGFDVLLRALARVDRHVVLTLVGFGPAERRLRRLARTLGIEPRLRWTGPLDQPAVRALYRTSDLFVLPSRVTPDGDRDGLPNVVLEALSQGLPVVVSRATAAVEVVTDGVTGRLVPPDDPDALAAVLAALVSDPAARRRLGQAAIDRLGTAWDVETAGRRLAALLRAALEADPLSPDAADRRPGLAATVPVPARDPDG